MSGASLREIDIIFLANAQHFINSLVELDFSHNPQFATFNSDCLFSFLRTLSRASFQSPGNGGLRVLELHSCGLSDPISVAKVIETVKLIRTMEYFNFAFNLTNPAIALDLLPDLAGCHSLQAYYKFHVRLNAIHCHC